MNDLKRFVDEKGIKKLAISRFLRTIPIDTSTTKNAGPFDVKYIQRFLTEECSVECDIILQNRKTSIQNESVLYFREVNDINQYDAIIFQPYTFNLYTGVWEKDTVDFVDLITRSFKGIVMVIYNDPNIQWSNPYPMMIQRPFVGKNIHDKYNPKPLIKSQDDVEAFNAIQVVAIYNGINWKTYWERSQKKETTIEPFHVINIKLSEWIFWNMLKLQNNSLFKTLRSLKEREYDILYFGSDRKGSREVLMKSIFAKDETLKKRWIGYNPNFKNTVYSTKKIEHQRLEDEVQSSIFSLVTGDYAHCGNIITYRFFENHMFGTLSMIHKSYDPYFRLVVNEDLRDYVYFESLEDVTSILNDVKKNQGLYDKLLNLQDREVQRLISNWQS